LQEVRKAQAANRARLDEEYRRLVGNLVEAQQLRGGEEWLANPALPEDIVRESMPGRLAALILMLHSLLFNI
jgi:DNA excision repair protein ERCC-2